MEQKRLVGVMVFGWMLIIGGILGLLGLLNINQHNLILKIWSGFGMIGKIAYFWNNLSFILAIIGGIYVLKLKKWARTLILATCVVTLFSQSLVNLRFLSKINEMTNNIIKQRKQEYIEKYKPEYQAEALKKMKQMEQVAPHIITLVLYLNFIVAIVWNLCAIFYFNRPKIKEQFT